MTNINLNKHLLVLAHTKMWATKKQNLNGERIMTNINLNKHLLVKAHAKMWAKTETEH